MGIFGLISYFMKLSSHRSTMVRHANNNKILKEQGESNEKEKSPVYNLIKVNFNSASRKAKVFFNCSKQYRTIERYFQQDYVKHPIYSDWKIKNRTIIKSIKLTNKDIENLNVNKDELIRLFAGDIVCSLNNDELVPSWFKKSTFEKIFKEYEENQIQLRNSTNIIYISNLEKCKNDLAKVNETIKEISNRKKMNLGKINKLTRKIFKIRNTNGKFLLKILSLGIYCLFRSNRYASLLDKRLIQFSEIDKSNCFELNKKINEKIEIELTIKKLSEDEEKSIIICNNNIENKRNECNEKISSIKPLSEECVNFTNFMPLKLFNGYKYKKIIGCYIILNTELNKCYVGQSKNIMRRLKQHFNGTVPKNIIFAKDYFYSKLENKDDLFSVKIIPLKTKDQLDDNEKSLIDQYDSYDSGYNSTSGNS